MNYQSFAEGMKAMTNITKNTLDKLGFKQGKGFGAEEDL
jgi:hypothetical protein